MKGNYHNSRTGDDGDQPQPATKVLKENKRKSKNATMTLCQNIVTFFQFFQFTANLEQSGSRFRRIVCEAYIFINSNLLSYKNCKQN